MAAPAAGDPGVRPLRPTCPHHFMAWSSPTPSPTPAFMPFIALSASGHHCPPSASATYRRVAAQTGSLSSRTPSRSKITSATRRRLRIGVGREAPVSIRPVSSVSKTGDSRFEPWVPRWDSAKAK
jgi:hypothetical protein